MKWLLAMFMVLMLAGCGDLQFFPDNQSTAGSVNPSDFSFTLQSPVAINTAVQSESVLITGTLTSGWPISVADATVGAKSAYSIDGLAFVSTPGTIFPNQHVRIQQTSAGTFSTLATTNVTIGTLTRTFQSQTAAQ